MADSIGKHSYNELVSLIVDRLGDDADLQLQAGAEATTIPEHLTGREDHTHDIGSASNVATSKQPLQLDIKPCTGVNVEGPHQGCTTAQDDYMSEAIKARQFCMHPTLLKSNNSTDSFMSMTASSQQSPVSSAPTVLWPSKRAWREASISHHASASRCPSRAAA